MSGSTGPAAGMSVVWGERCGSAQVLQAGSTRRAKSRDVTLPRATEPSRSCSARRDLAANFEYTHILCRHDEVSNSTTLFFSFPPIIR